MNQYDHIRKNLKDFSVPIDKDKLWANTVHAIPKKRNKRGAFYFLLAGALLAGSGILYYALSPSAITSEVTMNADASIAAQSTPAVIESINEKTVTTSNPASTRELYSDANNHSSIKNTTPAPTSTLRPSSEVESNINEIHTVTAKPASSSHSIIIPIAPEENKMNTVNTVNDENTEYATKDKFESPIDQQNEISASEKLAQNSRIVNFAPADISAISIDQLNIPSRNLSMGQPVIRQVKNKNNIILSILQGYGWSTLNIKSTTDELKPMADMLEGKIKSLENISTSLDASIRLPKGIRVGAGLQYSTLTTQLDYQQTSSEDFSQEGITAIIIGEDGSRQNLYGNVNVNRQTIIHSTRFTSHNRLAVEGMVSVPVFRSYRIETGIWVKAGYNLLYTSQGTTVNATGEPVKFSTEDNPYTLPSPFTFGAGIGTLYRLNTHWMLNARFGYEPLNYTHGLYDNQIAFHHSIFNLSIGGGYTF